MRDGDNILGRGVHNISLNIVVDEGAATGQIIPLKRRRNYLYLSWVTMNKRLVSRFFDFTQR